MILYSLISITIVWLVILVVTYFASGRYDRLANAVMVLIMGGVFIGVFGWLCIGYTATNSRTSTLLDASEYSIARTDHELVISYDDVLFHTNDHFLYSMPDSSLYVQFDESKNIYGAIVNRRIEVTTLNSPSK